MAVPLVMQISKESTVWSELTDDILAHSEEEIIVPLESSHCTEFGGRVFEMHPSGALYWPSQFSLLVADLHFEKGSSYHKTGQFLPPYDTHQTLEKLETVIKYFKPRRIFFLGDTFHDMSAWKRMPDVNKSRLLNVLKNLEAVWIEKSRSGERP